MCRQADELRAIAAQLTDPASVTALHDVADGLDWAADGLIEPPLAQSA